MILFAWFFLEREMFQARVVEKINLHILSIDYLSPTNALILTLFNLKYLNIKNIN
jgi:hypothetical protein